MPTTQPLPETLLHKAEPSATTSNKRKMASKASETPKRRKSKICDFWDAKIGGIKLDNKGELDITVKWSPTVVGIHDLTKGLIADLEALVVRKYGQAVWDKQKAKLA